MQTYLTEIPTQYLDLKAVENVSKTLEDLKEGTVYFVENLNFKPDEHSYVEPWIEPEDPNKPKEEEKKNDAPPVDLKKMSAAEKKKYEEELKKKQDEELLKLQSRSPAEIEKEQKRAQLKEEETRKRLQSEYFDFKTTYNFL